MIGTSSSTPAAASMPLLAGGAWWSWSGRGKGHLRGQGSPRRDPSGNVPVCRGQLWEPGPLGEGPSGRGRGVRRAAPTGCIGRRPNHGLDRIITAPTAVPPPVRYDEGPPAE